MNRNMALDVFKVILAFMIVGLHVDFLKDITLIGNYLTVNGVFRIAVPLFFLINGFYFYPTVTENKHGKWIKKVFYLYLFWLLFYSYFWFNLSEASLIEIAKIIKNITIGYYHLWYLPGMLGAAFLVLLLKKISTKFMVITILITFTMGVLIQYLGNYHFFENLMLDKLTNYNWIHRNFLFFGFPFFCLGFLINKLNLHKKITFKFTLILTIVGLSFLIVESYINYIQPLRDGGFDNFISLIVICPTLFILILKLDFQEKSKELALYSTGIYFIHILFFNIYKDLLYFNETTLTFIVIVSSIIASFFLIKINKKIKVIL